MTTNRIIRGLSELNELVIPQLTADADRTYAREDMCKTHVIDPSTPRVQTLPSTGVEKGEVISFVNLAVTEKITVEASGGGDIATFRNGYIELMARVDEPTTSGNWAILHVYGGASPAFRANRNNVQQDNITGEDQVEYTTTILDTNLAYDGITNFEWTPEVPGVYQLIAQITWAAGSLVASDQLILSIKALGTEFARTIDEADNTNQQTQTVSVITNAAINTNFQVFANNSDSSTSDISGSVALTFFAGARINSYNI